MRPHRSTSPAQPKRIAVWMLAMATVLAPLFLEAVHAPAPAGAVVAVPTATPTAVDPPAPFPCGKGKVYSTGTVPPACLRCDDGYYQDAEDATTSDPRSPNKVGCKAARLGHFAKGFAQEKDTPCLPGTFADVPALTACKDAALGQFVIATGATKPELCPAGTYGVKAKATIQAEGCRAAEAGSFVATAGQSGTTACAPGTYQPETGKTSCIPAAVGFYVPTSGAKAQTACPTATTTGAKTCVAAAPAPEPPSDDTDEPVDTDFVRPDGELCPAGTWSPDGLVPTASSCTPASPGTFVAEAGATEEVECPAGTYSGVFGATACTSADVGFYVPTAGASAQLPCPGATEPGASTCGDAVAAAADSTSGGRLAPILVALVAVLVAAGTFVFLRQRGLLGARALPSRGDAWAGFDDLGGAGPAPRGAGPQSTQRLPEAPPRAPEPPPSAAGPSAPPEPPSRPTRRFDDGLFDDDFDDL